MTSRLKTAATGTTDGPAKPIVSLASHGKRRWAARGSYLAGAAALLWPCWVRSSSRLGDLYDYSIHIAAARHILHGLHPYRDIQTPIQSLTFLFSSGCEWLLGPTYAALAWGNLTLALALSAALLLILDGVLPPVGAFLIALCLPVATVLQHGVPYHNSLAFAILTVQSLLAAKAAHEGRLGSARLAALLVLAILGGMAKLNFHLVGTGAAALGIFFSRRHRHRTHGTTLRSLRLAGGYVMFSLVAGPLLEMAWTGIYPQTWWFNVIARSGERITWLANVQTSKFWFSVVNNNYPNVFVGGIAFAAAMLFALGGIICFAAAPGGRRPGAIVRRAAPIVVSAYFLFGGCLFVLVNSETIILNAAYFVVGLLCVGLIYGDRIGAWAKYYFHGAALFLALALLLAAVVALGHYSRINYGREDIATRWIPAGEIDPSVKQFFGRLRFSPRTAALLSELFAVVDRYELRANKKLVYWGPGLELMNQLNGESQVPGLPLWYDRGVSVCDSDSPRIIERLRSSPYQWIIMSKMWSIHIPPPVLTYIQAAYEVERSDEYLIVCHRRPESALP
jgi:hypothetical protein